MSSLDSLRGLAALSVVFLHVLMLNYPNIATILSAFPWSGARQLSGLDGLLHAITTWSPLRLIWGGQEAVLVFFVLSGYVLSLDYLDGRGLRWGNFTLVRFCRLYLPFAAAILLALALRAITHSLLSNPQSSGSYWDSALTTRVLIDQALMLGHQSANFIDPPSWSLVHEMRVSLIFPPLVLLTLRAPPALAVVGSCLMTFAVSRIHVEPDVSWGAEIVQSLLATLSYLYLFVLGIVTANYQNKISALTKRTGTLGFTLLLIISLILLNARSNFGPFFVRHGAATTVLLGFGAAGVIALAASPGFLKRALEHPALVRLGRVSYSLYLTHILIILSLTPLIGAKATGILTLLFALPLAFLFHAVVELPATRLGRNLAAKARDGRMLGKPLPSGEH